MEKIYFKNVSGKNYIIPEISNKPITSDPNKILEVNKDVFESSYVIKNLINERKFSICQQEFQKEIVKDIQKNEGITRDRDQKKELNSVDFHELGRGKEKALVSQDRQDAVFSFGDIGEIVEFNKKEVIEEKIINTSNIKEIPKNQVWWRGPANDMGGYGKMNKYCLQGLSKKDLHIQLDMHNIPSMRNTIPLSQELEKMTENKVDLNSPAVWAIMPPKFPTRQGKIIYFTMLESNGVHPSFLNKLNNADEIWVPCSFNIDVLKNEKIKADLHKIPLGVDTDFYRPLSISSSQRANFNVKTKGFVFLSVFGWSLRKGYDVLLKSYLKTFSKSDDTTLLLVSRLNGSSSIESIKTIRDEIAQYIKTFCPDSSNHPHIVHIGVGIPEKEMPILYNMSDCFVLPSRGEGFCLPALEAGACGIPSIMTRCGGQLEFLNDENSYLVDIEGYGMEKQEIKDISSYYEDVPFAVLGSGAINGFSEAMRNAYVNKKESKGKGELLMNHIRKNFTWNNSVDLIYNRLTS